MENLENRKQDLEKLTHDQLIEHVIKLEGNLNQSNNDLDFWYSEFNKLNNRYNKLFTSLKSTIELWESLSK